MSTERKLRRQTARQKQAKGAELNRMSETTEKVEKTEKIERAFTPAQMLHLKGLQAEAEHAQAMSGYRQEAVQKYVDYLAEEHELNDVTLPEGQSWQLRPKGFVAVSDTKQAVPPATQTPAPNNSQPASDGAAEQPSAPPAPLETPSPVHQNGVAETA